MMPHSWGHTADDLWNMLSNKPREFWFTGDKYVRQDYIPPPDAIDHSVSTSPGQRQIVININLQKETT